MIIFQDNVILTLYNNPTKMFQTSFLPIFLKSKMYLRGSHQDVDFIHFGSILVYVGSCIHKNVKLVMYKVLCEKN